MKSTKNAQIGQKIKTARLLHGLSMSDLSKILGGVISKQMISNYEMGKNMPNEILQKAIIKALELPKNYFYNTTSSIHSIELRYIGTLTSKEFSKLESLIQIEISDYINIENLLGIKNKFTNPIFNILIKSTDDIEKALDILHKKWKLTEHAMPYLCSMLESRGIRIIEISYENNAFDGMSGVISNLHQPFIAINKHSTTERRRFTIAHELGHILLNTGDGFKDKERPCNYFAGAFLLSRQAIEYELGLRRNNLSLDELINIRENYGISVAATVHRAYDLNIINRKYYDHIYDEYINKNKSEQGWGSYKLSEHPRRFDLLKARALSEGILPDECKIRNLRIKIL